MGGQVGRVAPALLGPLVEPAELREPEGGGEVGGLEVRAQCLVVVADPHAVVAEEAEPVGHLVVVGRREAALAGHQVLRGVEAEHGRTEPAGALPVVRRAVGLGGVLHDPQAVALGDRHERVHVRHEAVEVDRQDRLRAGRDRRLHRGRVDAEVVLADVHQDRRGADPEDRAHRGVEAERDGDHLVAGADPERVQDRLERHRAVAHQDRVLHAAVGGPGLLEGGGPLPHREHPGAEDLEDGLLFGGADVGAGDRDHGTGSSGRRRTRRRRSGSGWHRRGRRRRPRSRREPGRRRPGRCRPGGRRPGRRTRRGAAGRRSRPSPGGGPGCRPRARDPARRG